jgi:hypothetical protein
MAEKDGKPVVEEEEEIPFVETDASGKPLTGKQAAKGKDEDDSDEPEAGDDDGDGEKLHLGADDDEDEKRRQRQERKKRQQKARQRQQQELQQLRQTNQQLAERLNRLEQGATGTTLAQLDDRINTAKGHVAQANAGLAQALKGNNPEAVTRAMDLRDQARDTLNYLSGMKQRFAANAEANRGREQPNGSGQGGGQEGNDVSPEVRQNVQRFMKKHSWYDPEGGDEDSQILLAIDNAIAREGFDPADDDYWEELEKRAAKRLPHHFKDAAKPRSPRVAGNGADGGGASRREAGSNYVRITPERKAAMQEAGAWDDPKKRNRMLKRYREYDAAHAAERRA